MQRGTREFFIFFASRRLGLACAGLEACGEGAPSPATLSEMVGEGSPRTSDVPKMDFRGSPRTFDVSEMVGAGSPRIRVKMLKRKLLCVIL